MITLSLLKYLEDNGLGTIDNDLFCEKLGVDAIGAYISILGVPREKGMRHRQDYIIYSRGNTDIQGYDKLNKIRVFLDNSYDICTLPSVPSVAESREFKNVTIMPPSSITNTGEDANGRVIWSFTGTIYY